MTKPGTVDTYAHRLADSCACGQSHSDVSPVRAVDIGTVVAEYNYHDESGVLLYQVRRYGPVKTFRQFRPDGSGGWIPGLDPKDRNGKPTGVKTRRILYRLDRLIEADPSATVWVCEGEKDVHAMESLGFVATTNPMGAGKWHMVNDCAKRYLKGRNVVIVAHDDTGSTTPTKGRDHAEDVAKRLKGIAASVRIIDPVRGDDAASWIEEGGTAEEFLRALPAIPEPKPPDPGEFECLAGKPIDSQANIKLALKKLGVTIKYDQFADLEVVSGLSGFGPWLDDAAMNHLRMAIDSLFNFRISKEFFYDMVNNYARESSFNPVCDYLSSLNWDKTPRIDSWLTAYAGADDNPYTRAVGRLVLVAAVRRARQPGCKFDEMLVLESSQGTNKSTALSILAVEQDWFTDDLPLGADTKKVIEQISGKWIVEAGELKGMSKADVHALKSFLSRRVDESRLSYGRKRATRPRQFVIIGTTNETSDYLRDSTGARRIMPVRIREFDVAALRRDRDRLWAEAAHAEAAGASIRLDPALYAHAAREQEDRRAQDAIEIQLQNALGGFEGRVLTHEVWRILGIDNRPLTQDEMARFGSAMRTLGWDRKRVKRNGNLDYIYCKGSESQWLSVRGLGFSAIVEPVMGGNPEE